MSRVISQREDLRLQMKQMEARERERRELEAQLEKARVGLLAEQKKAREQSDKLKEVGVVW